MKNLVWLTGLILMLCNANAYANDHRPHTAHQHGMAQLNIAQDGHTLQIELSSPAMNIVGFEHTPRDITQHRAIKQAVATLQNGIRLFTLTPAAVCKLTTADVDTALLQEATKHTTDHADFEARYVFACQSVAALNAIEIKLFALFPGIQELAVQLLTEQGQRAVHLTAAQARLQLKK